MLSGKLGYGRAQVAVAVIYASKRVGVPIDGKTNSGEARYREG